MCMNGSMAIPIHQLQSCEKERFHRPLCRAVKVLEHPDNLKLAFSVWLFQSHIHVEEFWPNLLYNVALGLQAFVYAELCCSITVGLNTWVFPFSVILFWICCCACDHCHIAWLSLGQTLPAFTLVYLFLVYKSNLRSTQLLKVLWLQNRPPPPPWQLVWGVCAGMLYLVFTNSGAVRNDQTSAFWSHRTLVFYSHAALQTCSSILFTERRLFFNCPVISFSI